MSNFLSPLFAAMPPDYVCKLAPELDELLDDEAVPHYPYDATIESAKDQISWIFHTSGSSGNPKPIFYSTKNIMAFSSGHLLERSETLLWDTYFPGQKILSLLPMFHVRAPVLSVPYGAKLTDMPSGRWCCDVDVCYDV